MRIDNHYLNMYLFRSKAPYVQFRRVPCLFVPYSFTSTVMPDLNSTVNLSSLTVTFSINRRISCSSYSVMAVVALAGTRSYRLYDYVVHPVQHFPPELSASVRAGGKSRRQHPHSRPWSWPASKAAFEVLEAECRCQLRFCHYPGSKGEFAK